MKIIRDTWLHFGRAMGLSLRNPVWVFVGMTQPVFYLVLFAPLLKKVVNAQGFPGDDAYQVFVPGLLVQLCLFGGLFVGFSLIDEMRNGVIERMRVTPTSRLALLLGRSLRDVVVLVVQGGLLIALSIPFGLSIDAGGALATLGLLALLGLGLSGLSYTLALKLKTEDALAPLAQTVAIPLLLLSGVLLPISLAPTWLQRVADANPLTHAVEAARSLFAGEMGETVVAQGVAITVGLTAVCVTVAARAFAKGTT
jgi:ABC-2 type transport system permease protein